MRPIDADALLKKTINNPLHVPYITKKDVIDMPPALNNQVNLCDSCTYTYPECPSEKDDVIFGNGIGNDNICACNKYQPTVQPIATDTNVGDKISRQQAIELIKNYCENGCDIAEDNWCPSCQREQFIKLLKALPTVPPEPQWIPVSERLPEEHESMFAKYYNTPKWSNSMWLKESDKMFVSVEVPGNEIIVDTAKMLDGKWFFGLSFVDKKVIAWMPLPEAYKPNK